MVKLVVERNSIESTTSNKTYLVCKYDDGSWACSCPKWIFTKGQKQNCKHIKELLFKQQIALPIQSTLTITGLNENEADKIMNDLMRGKN
jgi:predicted nucleic acid-binding Zn finger protein